MSARPGPGVMTRRPIWCRQDRTRGTLRCHGRPGRQLLRRGVPFLSAYLPFVKLHIDFPYQPKVLGLTDKAFRAHVIAMCHTRDHLTDGVISSSLVRAWIRSRTLNERVINELRSCNLWVTNSSSPDGGYILDGWEDFSTPRTQAESTSAHRAEAGRTSAERRRQQRVANSGNKNPVQDKTSEDKTSEDNVLLPSQPGDIDFAKAAKAWEDATGQLLNPRLGDNIADAITTSSIDWVLDAIKATGDAGVKGWRYTQAILDRWQREGRQATPSKNGHTPAVDVRTANEQYAEKMRAELAANPVIHDPADLERLRQKNERELEKRYGIAQSDPGKNGTNGHKPVEGGRLGEMPEVQALPSAAHS